MVRTPPRFPRPEQHRQISRADIRQPAPLFAEPEQHRQISRKDIDESKLVQILQGLGDPQPEARASQIAREHDFTLEDAANNNMDKLAERTASGTVHDKTNREDERTNFLRNYRK